MNSIINKKVNLDLASLDWNALVYLDAFQLQAMQEGRTDKEVSTVVEEATSGDYQHLVEVLSEYCEPNII